MFNLEVNTTCINKAFTRAKIPLMKRKMHDQMARLYAAAAETGKLDEGTPQSSLARILNVGSQHVHNWETRGPSKDALLAAQERIGVNATWVQNGVGPMFVGAASPETWCDNPSRELYPPRRRSLIRPSP